MERAMANVDLGPYRRIVQMFWDPEPTNDVAHDQPVWCLGRSYRISDKKNPKDDDHEPQTPPSAPKVEAEAEVEVEVEAQAQEAPEIARPPNPPTNAPATPPDSTSSSFSSSLAYDDPANDGGWPYGFINDFESKIWMTYRSEFEPIPRSTNPHATSALSLSMRLKSQLGDQSPFSSDSGWGCMIRSGQSLLANAIAMVRLGRGPDVYEDEFMKIAKPSGEDFHPTLVLVGTRLGIDKITHVYWEALIAALQMPQSVGIAGQVPTLPSHASNVLTRRSGRPSSSHYFIGAQGSFLFYLDPHHTRPALPYHEDPAEYTSEEIDSCHTPRLRRIHVREMDPSMLIGFLIQDEGDWQELKRRVKHVQGKSIIHIAERNAVLGGSSEGRESAIDEVETLSDDDADTIHEA
ncbi:Cysteine protease atg4 [Fusarium equiseti]|uniref:Cysteine protease n=1 Tax=Fusarium equiseti TaxID=61235 RepID=A0ABQ8RDR9_FUSEQ|nr:Cysteine protease atg4 [Fusarium equiseti]